MTIKDVFHLITLYETPEREQKAVYTLQSMNLKYKVHRFHKHKIGWKGCINSHVNLMRYAEQNDMEYIFICEDNIKKGSGNPILDYSPLMRFIKKRKWDIIFLGGYILRFWDYCRPTIYTNIYETRNNNHGTISYVIHRRLYKKILGMKINVHFDIFLYNFKCYIYSPFLFYHANNIISNVNTQSDWWRTIWFHPFMMKIHEKIFFDRKYLYIFFISMVIIYSVFKTFHFT